MNYKSIAVDGPSGAGKPLAGLMPGALSGLGLGFGSFQRLARILSAFKRLLRRIIIRRSIRGRGLPPRLTTAV